MIAALVVCLAIGVGSIPTGLILARLVTGRDIRQEGSGNIGAANVTRTAGRKIGALVAVLDACKGILPVLLARALGLDHWALALVGLAAVAGHDFSLFLGLRGGKGVATSVGAALALAPLVGIVTIVVWVGVLFGTGISSVASLSALTALPIIMAATGQPPTYVLLGIALLLLAALKHYENIIRLSQGTEPGFRKRRSADGA
jgi:glycerol-3-phosphate acyltransferase PlsY